MLLDASACGTPVHWTWSGWRSRMLARYRGKFRCDPPLLIGVRDFSDSTGKCTSQDRTDLLGHLIVVVLSRSIVECSSDLIALDLGDVAIGCPMGQLGDERLAQHTPRAGRLRYRLRPTLDMIRVLRYSVPPQHLSWRRLRWMVSWLGTTRPWARNRPLIWSGLQRFFSAPPPGDALNRRSVARADSVGAVPACRRAPCSVDSGPHAAWRCAVTRG